MELGRGEFRRRVHDEFFLRLRERFHSQRAELFVSLMRPEPNWKILDLGGSSGDFLKRVRNRGMDGDYVVADINGACEADALRNGFSFVQLDESAALPFGDHQFDVVICNSVIEHVTLPKDRCGAVGTESEWRGPSWKRQLQFAAEIQRIARGYFVQSPHKWFPVEQHTLVPGLNWLSHNHTLAVLRFTDRYWFRRGVFVDWNLLNTVEMKTLFPDARVIVERFLGIPKSIICYRQRRD
jgi:hypothetical protein